MVLELDPSLLAERYFVNIWNILRESFSYIEKDSHSQNVSVAIGGRDGDICLTVTDDGDGFDLETAELDRGYGLPNIKDRTDRLGRVLYIDSAPGAGTKLDIKIPVPVPSTRPTLV